MTLKSLTPQQWKSGLAAWLGWLFDGLDMHLYTVVAPVFVAGWLARRFGYRAAISLILLGAAVGTVIFFYAPVSDMRYALLGLSGLFALALLFALLLPDLRDEVK